MVSSREVAKYGPNAADFMRDFGSSLTAQIPHDKWTSTALRAEKREMRRVDRQMSYLSSPEYQKREWEEQKYRKGRETLIGKMIGENARRVQKQHPEMSWIKAHLYSTTKDPIGRMIKRMDRQGYTAEEIAKAVAARGGTKKASSGRSSG